MLRLDPPLEFAKLLLGNVQLAFYPRHPFVPGLVPACVAELKPFLLEPADVCLQPADAIGSCAPSAFVRSRGVG